MNTSVCVCVFLCKPASASHVYVHVKLVSAGGGCGLSVTYHRWNMRGMPTAEQQQDGCWKDGVRNEGQRDLLL